MTDEPLTTSQINDINEIVDDYKEQAFVISDPNNIEFAWDEVENCDPLNDRVENPLSKLLEYAKNNGINLNGAFSTWSNYSDYDRIVIRVTNNNIKLLSAEVLSASVQDLVDELATRNRDEVIKLLKAAGLAA